jgi:putative membrane-bound dehydrogenase-like protein
MNFTRSTGMMLLCSAPIFCLAAFARHSEIQQESLAGPPAKTPDDEKKTFQLLPGFQIDLVASEPQVIDPINMAFDEAGRLFVAEMRGYPNGGVGRGDIRSGIIKLLEDRDGDGVFETSTVYADSLAFPTGIMPYKGGLLVAVPPNLIYLEDRDGDGKAEVRRTLYTGFGFDNIQQLLNSLQWGLDNWVYACAGSNGGSITSAEKPDAPPVVLRNRGIRFHPDKPGSLEPTSGGGQYALAADDWGHWFTNTNSQHLRQIVLPDHYLRRNPYLAVPAVTLDIPDHGEACKVFRISPFEAWRVERTRRRKDDPAMRARLPATELVPGGFVTSGCSPVVYSADAFPPEYLGSTFICDPANNLIHQDRLESNGAVFKAVRTDPAKEFLASTDNWFRPVFLTTGPDGALYVADFYREVIETPLSLPDDIKQRLNLESRGKGRIWRISKRGHRPGKVPSLNNSSTKELVAALQKPNSWWRFTAQRMLVEKQAKDAGPELARAFEQSASPQGRVHALWTLLGVGLLSEDSVARALTDKDAGVRGQALILAEEFAAKSSSIRAKMVALASDADPMIRFQAAFSLGAITGSQATRALAEILKRDGADKWTVSAALSSINGQELNVLGSLIESRNAGEAMLDIYRRLAALIAARGNETDLQLCFKLVAGNSGRVEAWKGAMLEGIGEGLARSGRSLNRWWQQPPKGLEDSLEAVRKLIAQAAQSAQDPKASLDDRQAAARLLAFGQFSQVREPLVALLQPTEALPLQLAALHSLSTQVDKEVGPLLLAGWSGYGPALRREIIEAQFARKDRLRTLLQALEDGRVRAADLDPARREQLKRHSDSAIRTRALKTFENAGTSDRKKVVDDYRIALSMPSDIARGKAVFKRVCASCHRLEEVGNEVGPDLLSALRTKTPETLLSDVFDPSKEVDPRFINYLVTMRDGRSLTGMIAAESANSITLRRAEKAEDLVLRNQIDQVAGTSKSLMPENLETLLTKQNFADVVAYLLRVAGVR